VATLQTDTKERTVPMAVSVTMPQLGESVTEGTVTRWLKNVGDTVVADEPLLEVSTDKVDTEIPAPASGVLLSITAGEDETVAVGGELAVIGEASESPAPSASPAPAAPAAAPAPAPAAPAPVFAPSPTPAAPAPAAPAAATAPAPAAAAPAPAADPSPAPSGPGTAVTMPALGESVTEGTVTRWLKQVGDAVAADEPLLEVSTDKVDTEIPAPRLGAAGDQCRPRRHGARRRPARRDRCGRGAVGRCPCSGCCARGPGSSPAGSCGSCSCARGSCGSGSGGCDSCPARPACSCACGGDPRPGTVGSGTVRSGSGSAL
jgi:2-oxoglutarate dehydrogenase E2 component (dihydrolipoamide succinyltransferase)